MTRQTTGSSRHSSASADRKKKTDEKQTPPAHSLASIRKYLLTGLIAAVIIGCGVFFFTRSDSATASGIAYLNSQDAVNIDNLISETATKRRSRMLQAVEEGKSTIFSLYNNSLIFGDSRVYGFGSYGFVPEKQVLAEAGATIQNITDYIDVVQSTQPEKIYFSYGVNDMGLNIGEDRGENGYAAVFEEQIDQLLAVSPNSQIIINSIIPATPARIEESPRWGKTDEFNQQIKALCEKRGWTYVDNSALADGGNADIYQPDGVHFQTNFYPIWAQNMIFAAMN